MGFCSTGESIHNPCKMGGVVGRSPGTTKEPTVPLENWAVFPPHQFAQLLVCANRFGRKPPGFPLKFRQRLASNKPSVGTQWEPPPD